MVSEAPVNTGPQRRASFALLVACLTLGASGNARAQERLVNNDFVVELVDGPILAGAPILGIGGSYAAHAEGIGGSGWNPAAAATRPLWEEDRIEVEPTVSWLLPGVFSGQDFFNNGQGAGVGELDGFLFLAAGLRLQVGDFGIAGTGAGELFSTVSGTGDPVNVIFARWRLAAGHALRGGDVVVAGGIRMATLWVDRDPGSILKPGVRLATFAGFGAEAGVVIKPEGRSYRLGATLRTPIRAELRPRGQAEENLGLVTAGGLLLPKSVRIPWQTQLGFAWQFGPRPFNRGWSGESVGPEVECDTANESSTSSCLETPPQDEELASVDPEPEPADSLPRRYVRLSVELLLVGSTPNAVGVDAFLDQQRRTAGRRYTVGARAGIEAEPIANRLKVRLGSYYEPSRNVGISPRAHGTFGFDLRLFTIRSMSFAMSTVFDVARDYINFGIGVAVWH